MFSIYFYMNNKLRCKSPASTISLHSINFHLFFFDEKTNILTQWHFVNKNIWSKWPIAANHCYWQICCSPIKWGKVSKCIQKHQISNCVKPFPGQLIPYIQIIIFHWTNFNAILSLFKHYSMKSQPKLFLKVQINFIHRLNIGKLN